MISKIHTYDEIRERKMYEYCRRRFALTLRRRCGEFCKLAKEKRGEQGEAPEERGQFRDS